MDNYKLTGAYYPPSDYERAEGKIPANAQWLKFSALVDSVKESNKTCMPFKANTREREAFDEIFNKPVSRMQQNEIDSGMTDKDFG